MIMSHGTRGPKGDPQPADWYRRRTEDRERLQVCCRPPSDDGDVPQVCFYYGGLDRAYAANNGVLPLGTFLEHFEEVSHAPE